MAKRQKAWAVRARAALVQSLGGRCAQCGSTHSLEIDHIHGRDYRLSDLSSDQRVSRYRREAQANLLQVLCDPCNRAKR